METIGILHQSKIPNAKPLAEEVKTWLAERGVAAWVGSIWNETAVNKHMPSFDMVIVLGGDGSTLHAARLALAHRVPIFGINMGRVGFLSEAQPHNWPERLEKVLAGDYWREKRLMAHAELHRDGEVIENFYALNDVVVGRGGAVRVLRLHLRVDGDLVTTYTADAIIVATPTGSTAYSMAAGGPLLPPMLQNFVVVPVAAHLTLDRPLVLHENAEISIQVEMDHEATLTADGQAGVPLQDGDIIVVKKHANHGCFIRVDTPGYFYRRLLRRLGFRR
ncbi:MAG: NAD(+)/NADH kinase [Anaerolineae bacterium]